MAEYLDRERAIQKVKNVIATEWFRGNYAAVEPLQRVVDVQLGRMTAADVAPVVHGRWLCVDTDIEQFFLCNRCKKKEYWESKYCPNCGAKMDEEEHNNV